LVFTGVTGSFHQGNIIIRSHQRTRCDHHFRKLIVGVQACLCLTMRQQIEGDHAIGQIALWLTVWDDRLDDLIPDIVI
jgi:hypothetical protein